MNSRSILVLILVVLCGAALWGVVAQGHQLSALRDEQNHLATADKAVKPAAPETEPIATPPAEVPRELLQLRAEVARLSQQKREFAAAVSENERLRVQLENRGTNSASGGKVGAGYVRKSEMKWLGYNSPEDTVQSLFWAMQNHDLDKFMEAFTPEAAQRFREAAHLASDSAEQFFKSQEMEMPPVFRIAERKQNDDGTIRLEVQVALDAPGEQLFFRQIGGQWKITDRH